MRATPAEAAIALVAWESARNESARTDPLWCPIQPPHPAPGVWKGRSQHGRLRGTLTGDLAAT